MVCGIKILAIEYYDQQKCVIFWIYLAQNSNEMFLSATKNWIKRENDRFILLVILYKKKNNNNSNNK